MKEYYVVFMVMYKTGHDGETDQSISHVRVKGRRPILMDIKDHITDQYNEIVGWQFFSYMEFADEFEYVNFFGIDAAQHLVLNLKED